VQQLIHSPDGRWALALTKLRGRDRFAVLTMDLSRCAPQHSVDLAAIADDVRFDGEDAVLRVAGREQRLPLADPRIR
jgi:hypothetical protein